MDHAAMNSEEYVVVTTVTSFFQYHSAGVWLTRWKIPVIAGPATKS